MSHQDGENNEFMFEDDVTSQLKKGKNAAMEHFYPKFDGDSKETAMPKLCWNVQFLSK